MSQGERRPAARHPWGLFWAWVVAGLMLRAASAALLSAKLAAAEGAGFAKDGIDLYEPMVKSLLSGKGFTLPPWGATASHVPVYPLLVAGARLILHSPRLSVLAVQSISGALVVGMIFMLATRMLGSKAGHLSAALALFYPDLMVYSLFNLSEMPYLVFLLAASLLICSLMRSRNRVEAVLLGLALGLGALTRESAAGLILLWPGVLALLRDRDGRRRLETGGLVAAVALLTLMPWWVRNWVVFHEIIPLTTKGAQNIYEGTVIRDSPLSGYHSPEMSEWPANEREVRVAERLEGAESSHERDRIYLEAAAENVLSDPLGQLSHIGRKFLFLWRSSLGPRHAKRVRFGPVLWAAAVWHYCILGLALVGFWRLRRNVEIASILMLPVAYFTIVHLFIGDAEPRYHLPAVPALLIAASALVLFIGSGVETLGKRRKLVPTGQERMIHGSGDGST